MAILFGAALSPFVRKTTIALHFKKIEFEAINIMPGMTDPDPRFITASPLGKIPAYVDANVSLSDSSVICEYLDETVTGEYPLLPSDPIERARCRWLEEYSDTAMATSIGGSFFFQKIVKPLRGQEPDEAVVNCAINELIPTNIDYIESQLHSDQEYFNNGRLSIADIAVYSQLINAEHLDFNIDPARWPRTSRFMEHMKTIEIIDTSLKIERKMLQSMGISTQ